MNEAEVVPLVFGVGHIGTIERWCVNVGDIEEYPPTPSGSQLGAQYAMVQYCGGDAVIDVLEQAGVRVVFGIPSVHNLPIYDAIRRRGSIRAITVRHEQAAAGAADAYARVTGRIGVFLTSTGPGAANAMGGLLEACVSGSPVLHLTGQVETRYLGEGRGYIHEVPDQAGMLRALSKAVHRPDAASSISRVLARAISQALTAPCGPVSVELPIDLQYAQTVPTPRDELAIALAPAPTPGPDPGTVARAAELACSSRRPLVWAGGGAVSAGAALEVAELVRFLGAGLLTSPNGRGVLDEGDSACIGNLSWDPGVRALCRDADLLVSVGTRYQGPNTENWQMGLPSAIIQIDVVPDRPARNYAATLSLAGDARESVRAILDSIASEGRRSSTDRAWSARVAEVGTSARAAMRELIGAQVALLDELAASISGNTAVVKDSTISAYTWGNRLLPVARPRRAIMPNSFAIGLGLAHAIGASAAVVDDFDGNSPDGVVLIVGDGGFMLSATELATLAAEGLPVAVVVFCDGGYGILRNIQDKQYGEGSGRIGVELGSPDFVALAGALGVQATRVTTASQMGVAVRDGLEHARPLLVEVDLDAIGPMSRAYTGTSRAPLA